MRKIHSQMSIIITLIIISVGLGSCLDESSKTIACQPFSSHNDLRWFAGLEGDTLTFRNQHNVEKSFDIEDKYIIHTTSYVSLPGCNCHDVWGILLVDGPDSIGVFGQHVYNQYEEFRMSNLNIKIGGKLTSFNTQQRSILSTYSLGGIEFRNVIRFQHNFTDTLQFRAVHIAPERGIIRMERVNGDVWTNTQLDRTMRFDFDSFRFSERACK